MNKFRQCQNRCDDVRNDRQRKNCNDDCGDERFGHGQNRPSSSDRHVCIDTYSDGEHTVVVTEQHIIRLITKQDNVKGKFSGGVPCAILGSNPD